MTRNRKSAKKAGARFERSIADYLAAEVDDRIDRRVKTGAKDRGDIAGLRHMGGRVVLECKDVAKLALGTWATEADIERGNDDAIAGFVVHKRRGTADPGDQYVTGTMRDLIALLTGQRPQICHRMPADSLAGSPEGDGTTTAKRTPQIATNPATDSTRNEDA